MLIALIRFVFGFTAAMLVAGVVQVLFVAGADLLRGGAGSPSSLGLLMLLAATQSAVFAAPFAILAAIFSPSRRAPAAAYFVAVGLLIAFAGFLAQYAGETGAETIFNRYALAAYLVSGFAAGLTYWYTAVPKKQSSTA